MGKTGHGKSATGNTLLQYSAFEESCFVMSKTQLLTKHSSEDLVVYDTRGPYDEGEEVYESSLYAAKELKHAMKHCLTVDAFVLVLNVQSKFTKEEKYTIELYKTILGSDAFKTNVIIVMTHGENFAERNTFQMWLNQQTGYFRDLVSECKNRVVLFFNKGDNNEKSRCRAELLKKIQTITCAYTFKKFDQNVAIRKSYLAQLNVKKFKSNFNNMIRQLTLRVEKLEKSNDRTQLDIDRLLNEIIKEKEFLEEVKTVDDPLIKESRELVNLYSRVKKIRPSGCVIL